MTKKKKPSRQTILTAVEAGANLIGYVLEEAPTGPIGKTIGAVLRDVVPRVIGWFSKPVKQVKDDALYRALRKPLRSRVLLEVEKSKRR